MAEIIELQLYSKGRKKLILNECFFILGKNILLTLVMFVCPMMMLNFFLLEDVRFALLFVPFCIFYPKMMIWYFKSNREKFKAWNVCGMSADEVRKKFGGLYYRLSVIGLFAGLAYFFIDNVLMLKRRVNTALAGFFYQWTESKIVANNIAAYLALLVFLFVLILVNKKIIIGKYFDLYVPLEKNEEKVFLANRIGVNYPLDKDKNVRDNIRIPVELSDTDESSMNKLIERGLAIGRLTNISELKCNDLSEYELFRVKFGRALIIKPKEIYIGREWEKLTEEQKKEMERHFLEIKKCMNVEVIFDNW